MQSDNQFKRIAIVCDDLMQFGGAERVLLGFCDLFPEAPVYTPAASARWKKVFKERGTRLYTSHLQKFPFIEKLNRYYASIFLHVLAIESFDFSNYDLVISVSSRFAHGILTKPQTTHICYLNTPGRMIWEPDVYFENETYGFLRSIKGLARPFLSPFLMFLRMWDYTAAQRVDRFISNCRVTQERVKKYYKRDSSLVNPFVDTEKLRTDSTSSAGSYFLVISRLLSWKKVDLAVKVCSKNSLPLKIVGEGPDMERLKSFAGSTVEFLGYVDDLKKRELILRCKALINTQKEDFGIVPLEAMFLGKPVIAYGRGGVLETVVPGETGVYFNPQDERSLEEVLLNFQPENFSSEKCVQRAKEFSKHKFNSLVREIVNEVYL